MLVMEVQNTANLNKILIFVPISTAVCQYDMVKKGERTDFLIRLSSYLGEKKSSPTTMFCLMFASFIENMSVVNDKPNSQNYLQQQDLS